MRTLSYLCAQQLPAVRSQTAGTGHWLTITVYLTQQYLTGHRAVSIRIDCVLVSSYISLRYQCYINVIYGMMTTIKSLQQHMLVLLLLLVNSNIKIVLLSGSSVVKMLSTLPILLTVLTSHNILSGQFWSPRQF